MTTWNGVIFRIGVISPLSRISHHPTAESHDTTALTWLRRLAVRDGDKPCFVSRDPHNIRLAPW